jgi:excinuclease UvrABC nuclease subunit
MVCYINGEPAKGMYRKFHLDEKTRAMISTR